VTKVVAKTNLLKWRVPCRYMAGREELVSGFQPPVIYDLVFVKNGLSHTRANADAELMMLMSLLYLSVRVRVAEAVEFIEA